MRKYNPALLLKLQRIAEQLTDVMEDLDNDGRDVGELFRARHCILHYVHDAQIDSK